MSTDLPDVNISNEKQGFLNSFQSVSWNENPSYFIYSLLAALAENNMIAGDFPGAEAATLSKHLIYLAQDKPFLQKIEPKLLDTKYADALNDVVLKVHERIAAAESKPLRGTALSTLDDNFSTGLHNLYDLIWTQGKSVFETEDKEIPTLNKLHETFDFAAHNARENLLGDVITYTAHYMVVPPESKAHFPSYPEPSRRMLVRSGYNEILEKLKEATSSGLSVAILGQSGIGKTYFLAYLLVNRMLENQDTCLQLDADYVYYFTRRGAFRYGANDMQLAEDCPEDSDLWYLIDCNENLPELSAAAGRVQRALRPKAGKGAKIIQTTSPATKHYKDWTKQRLSVNLWMDVCKWEDIYLMRLLERGKEKNPAETLADTKLLAFYFSKFGPSARVCLRSAAFPDQANVQDHKIMSALANLKGKDVGLWLPSSEKIPLEASHDLYIVRPKNDEMTLAEVELGSIYIEQLMTSAAEKARHGFAPQLYNTLR